MKNFTLPLTFGLGAWWTLPTVAQQAPAPQRQCYVGLGGVAGSYQLAVRHENSVLAPQLVGGFWLSPRLALEASLTLSHDHTDQSSVGIYVRSDSARPAAVRPAVFRSVHQQRTQALAITFRYALLPRPEQRLQFDALLGAAPVHSDVYGFNATYDQATLATVRNAPYVRYDLTGGCLLLGPSLRYRLGPRLHATAEYVANFAPGGQPREARNRLSGTLGLSLRYGFGGSRP